MKINKLNKKSKLLIVFGIVLLIAGAGIIYANAAKNNNEKNESNGGDASISNDTSSTGAPYDLSPASEQEKNENDQHKDSLTKKVENTDQPGSKKQVAVVITSATSSNINAYISGVLEDGGACTATFIKGAQTITRTSGGFSNVSTTSCTPISPLLPSSGTWTLTYSYQSPTSEGSTKTTVEVP